VTPALYGVCARYAGDALLERDEHAYQIGSGEALPGYSCAVYIAIGVDGGVDYVGSVDRTMAGADRRRLAEHLKDNERFRNWATMYLVPLRPDTPHAAVLDIEGRIGAHLGPTRNRRLPKLGARRVVS
jgi:hypothetical protein